MSQVLETSKLEPWDILAPYPRRKESNIIEFPQAISIIKSAFSRMNPSMGEFVEFMYKKKWIDGLVTPNRAPGAYCTKFLKMREPRVFMTYEGSMGNLITLAHELGHAYHNWVMQDLPLSKTHYPMTLAETASIFAETLVRDYLFEHAKSKEDQLEIAWQEALSAATMLCNIPARFEFEKELSSRREKNILSAHELKNLTIQSWEKWYETSLNQYDPMFWASKLHFSMTHIPFYNYPYLFGYLLSLSLYKKKQEPLFFQNYVNLLRDTGTMTCEEITLKHMGMSCDRSSFWDLGFAEVTRMIIRFENLLAQ
jgi:oligoendopeptidase F